MIASQAPFVDKVALVTGASRGIGRAVALELARGGADVVVNYRRDADAAAETAAGVEGYGRRALVVRADVGNVDQVAMLFESAVQALEGVDLLVCNAAAGRFGYLADISPKALNLALQVNTLSTFLCGQKAAPLMKSRGGGRIVVLTSPGVLRTFPGYITVGASKAALDAVVRYLAVELASDNIVVNAVSPGICDTDALRRYIGQEQIDAYVARTPRGRTVTPEEVAALVAFLCRDETSMICGQTIAIDGGFFLPF